MIHCRKCQAANSSDQRYCQKCHADLLPGESLGTRIGYLVAAGLVTALGVFVLIRINNGQIPINLDCALSSPIFWGIMVVIVPIYGLSQALRPTPHYRRYLNRAKRHTDLDSQQSLADLNQALELAPSKERAGILKERANLYQKLGLEKQAVRDKLASTQEEGAFQGGEMIAKLTGIDSDALVNGLRSGVQNALLKSGEAVALGYCSKCKDAVLLDDDLHCRSHKRGKIQEVRFAIPEEEDQTRLAILNSHDQMTRRMRARRAISLVALLVLCGALIYLFELFPSDPTPIPTPTDRVAEAIVTQDITSPEIFTGSEEATEPELVLTTTPTTVIELVAVVLNKSINLRAGPGKSYAIVGSLEKGQEVLITGRNEPGDWLCFDTREGGEAWVYGPLVSLQGDSLDLPVEDVQP